MLKTCPIGHQFYKTSDCNVCPTCEKTNNSPNHFFGVLAAPARRALHKANILSISDLQNYSENELLALHGIGKTTIPKLKILLENEGLTFKTISNNVS